MTNNRYDPDGILDDLEDVTTAPASNYDHLEYNSTTGKWENVASIRVVATTTTTRLLAGGITK